MGYLALIWFQHPTSTKYNSLVSLNFGNLSSYMYEGPLNFFFFPFNNIIPMHPNIICAWWCFTKKTKKKKKEVFNFYHACILINTKHTNLEIYSFKSLLWVYRSISPKKRTSLCYGLFKSGDRPSPSIEEIQTLKGEAFYAPTRTTIFCWWSVHIN